MEPVCAVTTGQPCIESENKLPSSEFINETSNQQAHVNSEADKPSVETPNKTEEVKLEKAETQSCPSQEDTKVEEKTGSKIKGESVRVEGRAGE